MLLEAVPILIDDLRSLRRTRAAWRSEERRASHLLRDVPDVPYSVDPAVLLPAEDPRAESGVIRVTALAHPTDALQRDLAEAHRVHLPTPTLGPLAGYDVADPRVSGLSNCAFGDRAGWDLQAREWARFLDEHHLFRDLAPALRFASFIEERVPEHAPWLVFALYVATE
jgi:hypothetical protein